MLFKISAMLFSALICAIAALGVRAIFVTSSGRLLPFSEKLAVAVNTHQLVLLRPELVRLIPQRILDET
jgi:hypothetical protein